MPMGSVTDLDGSPRFIDDPMTPDTGNGTPPIVDMGAYEFGTLCLPVTASETVRLGIPANPMAFMPGISGPPIVGCTWEPVVTPFLPGAVLDFAFVSVAAPINASTGLGTFLCNIPPPAQIFVVPASTPFSILIPNDCGLAGRSVCSQAGSFAPGPSIQLANALDLVVGTF